MGRRNARKLAFYLLFQYDFVKDGNFDEIKETFLTLNDEEITENDKNYILSKTEGTMKNLEEIDDLIGKYAKGWSVERMSKVDKDVYKRQAYTESGKKEQIKG